MSRAPNSPGGPSRRRSAAAARTGIAPPAGNVAASPAWLGDGALVISPLSRSPVGGRQRCRSTRARGRRARQHDGEPASWPSAGVGGGHDDPAAGERGGESERGVPAAGVYPRSHCPRLGAPPGLGAGGDPYGAGRGASDPAGDDEPSAGAADACDPQPRRYPTGTLPARGRLAARGGASRRLPGCRCCCSPAAGGVFGSVAGRSSPDAGGAGGAGAGGRGGGGGGGP